MQLHTHVVQPLTSELSEGWLFPLQQLQDVNEVKVVNATTPCDSACV